MALAVLAAELVVVILALRSVAARKGQPVSSKVWAMRWWLFIALWIVWFSAGVATVQSIRSSEFWVVCMVLPGLLAFLFRLLGVALGRAARHRRAVRAVEAAGNSVHRPAPSAESATYRECTTRSVTTPATERGTTTRSALVRLASHLIRFALSPSGGDANVWGQSMSGSTCIYCGSISYGAGCPQSPHGRHVHSGRKRRTA
jgi:hypothetical protein